MNATRQITLTKEQYNVLTLALSSKTCNIQDNLARKDFGTDLILREVAELRILDNVHNALIRQWRDAASN